MVNAKMMIKVRGWCRVDDRASDFLNDWFGSDSSWLFILLDYLKIQKAYQ